MKIGIITGNTGSVRSGMGNYIYQIVSNLKKNPSLHLTLIANEKQQIFSDLPVITPDYPFPGFSFLLWSQILSLQKKIFSKFDVVHNPAHFPLLFKPSLRYVCTIHDITPILHPQFHPLWRTLYSRIALPRLISCSDKIIADSQQTKKDLISYYHVPEDKIKVIYLGASEEYKKLDLPAVDAIRQKYHLKDQFILFIGNLEPRKNIPNLIRAFFLCRKHNVDLKLVIAGKKGWKFEEIFTTISQHHLEDSVVFLDYVPHEDLPALYNAASLFVYIPFYEGFGLPVLEAMRCGLPVITSNVSSLPEIVGAGGIMVDPSDVKGIAEKMTLLLSDKDLREENMRYNRSRCSLFSWENCARQTQDVYNEVCRRDQVVRER